jgi:hypothetical protein
MFFRLLGILAMLKDWDVAVSMGDDVAVPVGLGKMKNEIMDRPHFCLTKVKWAGPDLNR